MSSALHLPDLDLAAQRPAEIRVTLPQQDGAAVDAAQRPSAVTPTQIIIGDQQPASARVGRMSSGIQVHISTRDKGGQVRGQPRAVHAWAAHAWMCVGAVSGVYGGGELLHCRARRREGA